MPASGSWVPLLDVRQMLLESELLSSSYHRESQMTRRARRRILGGKKSLNPILMLEEERPVRPIQH